MLESITGVLGAEAPDYVKANGLVLSHVTNAFVANVLRVLGDGGEEVNVLNLMQARRDFTNTCLDFDVDFHPDKDKDHLLYRQEIEDNPYFASAKRVFDSVFVVENIVSEVDELEARLESERNFIAELRERIEQLGDDDPEANSLYDSLDQREEFVEAGSNQLRVLKADMRLKKLQLYSCVADHMNLAEWKDFSKSTALQNASLKFSRLFRDNDDIVAIDKVATAANNELKSIDIVGEADEVMNLADQFFSSVVDSSKVQSSDPVLDGFVKGMTEIDKKLKRSILRVAYANDYGFEKGFRFASSDVFGKYFKLSRAVSNILKAINTERGKKPEVSVDEIKKLCLSSFEPLFSGVGGESFRGALSKRGSEYQILKQVDSVIEKRSSNLDQWSKFYNHGYMSVVENAALRGKVVDASSSVEMLRSALSREPVDVQAVRRGFLSLYETVSSLPKYSADVAKTLRDASGTGSSKAIDNLFQLHGNVSAATKDCLDFVNDRFDFVKYNEGLSLKNSLLDDDYNTKLIQDLDTLLDKLDDVRDQSNQVIRGVQFALMPKKKITIGVQTGQDQGVQTGQDQGVQTGQDQGVQTGQDQGVQTGQDQGVQTDLSPDQDVLRELAKVTQRIPPLNAKTATDFQDSVDYAPIRKDQMQRSPYFQDSGIDTSFDGYGEVFAASELRLDLPSAIEKNDAYCAARGKTAKFVNDRIGLSRRQDIMENIKRSLLGALQDGVKEGKIPQEAQNYVSDIVGNENGVSVNKKHLLTTMSLLGTRNDINGNSLSVDDQADLLAMVSAYDALSKCKEPMQYDDFASFLNQVDRGFRSDFGKLIVDLADKETDLSYWQKNERLEQVIDDIGGIKSLDVVYDSLSGKGVSDVQDSGFSSNKLFWLSNYSGIKKRIFPETSDPYDRDSEAAAAVVKKRFSMLHSGTDKDIGDLELVAGLRDAVEDFRKKCAIEIGTYSTVLKQLGIYSAKNKEARADVDDFYSAVHEAELRLHQLDAAIAALSSCEKSSYDEKGFEDVKMITKKILENVQEIDSNMAKSQHVVQKTCRSVEKKGRTLLAILFAVSVVITIVGAVLALVNLGKSVEKELHPNQPDIKDTTDSVHRVDGVSTPGEKPDINVDMSKIDMLNHHFAPGYDQNGFYVNVNAGHPEMPAEWKLISDDHITIGQMINAFTHPDIGIRGEDFTGKMYDWNAMQTNSHFHSAVNYVNQQGSFAGPAQDDIMKTVTEIDNWMKEYNIADADPKLDYQNILQNGTIADLGKIKSEFEMFVTKINEAAQNADLQSQMDHNNAAKEDLLNNTIMTGKPIKDTITYTYTEHLPPVDNHALNVAGTAIAATGGAASLVTGGLFVNKLRSNTGKRTIPKMAERRGGRVADSGSRGLPDGRRGLSRRVSDGLDRRVEMQPYTR